MQELSKDFLLVLFCAAFIFLEFFPMITRGLVLLFTARWIYYYNYEEVWCWLYAYRIKKVIDGTAKV